jgi:allantoin racemase
VFAACTHRRFYNQPCGASDQFISLLGASASGRSDIETAEDVMALIDRKIRVAFVVGDYPPEERKRREDAALAYSSPEVEVGIVSVKASPYYIGNAPDLLGLAVPPFLDAFREAEKQGYDAVVPLGTLDLGVDAGRSVVDIPVVGPSESMLHIGSMLGRRFGIIVYDDFVQPLIYRMVERFNMIPKVIGWRSSGFELPDIIANRDKVVETFVKNAHDLVKMGADVIMPMGITQCPVHIKPDWLMKEIGVPVVEGIGAPIRLAAALVSLKLNYSRKYWPKSPLFDGK